MLSWDNSDIADLRDPIDPTENADPIDPIDANDPMLPMDNTDPSEQIDRKEFFERHDSMETSSYEQTPAGPADFPTSMGLEHLQWPGLTTTREPPWPSLSAAR